MSFTCSEGEQLQSLRGIYISIMTYSLHPSNTDFRQYCHHISRVPSLGHLCCSFVLFAIRRSLVFTKLKKTRIIMHFNINIAAAILAFTSLSTAGLVPAAAAPATNLQARQGPEGPPVQPQPDGNPPPPPPPPPPPQGGGGGSGGSPPPPPAVKRQDGGPDGPPLPQPTYVTQAPPPPPPPQGGGGPDGSQCVTQIPPQAPEKRQVVVTSVVTVTQAGPPAGGPAPPAPTQG